jgi:hypothetical protein
VYFVKYLGAMTVHMVMNSIVGISLILLKTLLLDYMCIFSGTKHLL